MKNIFDEVRIGDLKLRNRICRSGTDEDLCPGGYISDACIEVYRKLAKGGIGFIAIGMAEVSQAAMFTPHTMTSYHDTFTERLRIICNMIHDCGGACYVQLSHSGMKSRALEPPYMGPSEYRSSPYSYAREMTREEILSTETEFAVAAEKCVVAGADGVQIHNAHGYLLSAFCCPLTNRREDEYGGSAENRVRFTIETYSAIRKAVGSEFPVGIKTNCSDLCEPGLTVEDCKHMVRELARLGLNWVEISAGGPILKTINEVDRFLPPKKYDDDPPFFRAAAEIADAVDVPVFCVRGFRDPKIADRCLSESRIEGISMCMPFIREPDLVNRWKSGDLTKAKCTTCYGCGKQTKWAIFGEAKPAHEEEPRFCCIAEK